MERDIVEDLHERQLAALEQRLRQALLDDDHDALTALVSPALFMMDGQGGRLLDLPWLGDWLAGNLQVRSLQSYAVETLLCGRLALLSSDVRLSVRGQGPGARAETAPAAGVDLQFRRKRRAAVVDGGTGRMSAVRPLSGPAHRQVVGSSLSL